MTYPYQRTDAQRSSQRPPEPPYPQDPTTATRRLCAGAYLDDTFRNDSLRYVYYSPRRVLAPSHGFDAVPVLAHCLRARNGAIVRDAAIVVTVFIAACVKFLALLLVLALIANLQITIATYRLGRDTFRRLRAGESVGLAALTPRALLLVVGWLLVIFVDMIAFGAAGKQATESLGSFEGAEQVETAAAAVAVVSMNLALVIFLYPLGFSLWRQAELSRLTPGSQIARPAGTARLEEVARQQRGNTTVYSGFKPYVGSGDVLSTWGFAQRLVRAERQFREPNGTGAPHTAWPPERDREFQQPPFDAQELVDYVRDHLSTLLPHREAEEQIAGLTIEDRVCLAGTEVSDLSPYTPPELMAAVIRHPTTPARHFLACQVFAWGGELITTVYVHIAVQGKSLYLELTTTVLPPCDERFRIIDTVEGNGVMAWARAVKNGLVETPSAIWRAPLNLTAAVINLFVGAAGGPGANVRLIRGYDYGARFGIRELGSEPTGMRFLTQLQDVKKYQRLIERRVFASVLDFLDDREVDTIEFRARAASVLNVNGGVNTINGNSTFNGPVAGRDVNGGDNR